MTPFSDIRLLVFRQKPERLFRLIIVPLQPQATASDARTARRWQIRRAGAACCEFMGGWPGPVAHFFDTVCVWISPMSIHRPSPLSTPQVLWKMLDATSHGLT